MNALDADRVARLAQVLQAQPREVLVAAARLARLNEQGAIDPARQRAILCEAGLASTETAAALLLTPIASHALDDTDRALASLWPPGG